MKNSGLVWTIVLLIACGYLVVRTSQGEMGRVYVRAVEVKAEAKDGAEEKTLWTKYVDTDPKFAGQPGVSFSWPRTIGLWVAAFLTLAVCSFLYADNVFYKISESLFIGVSAAYVMVVGFWTAIVGNLFGKLTPDFIRDTAIPGLDEPRQISYLVPLIFGVMMLMRLSPKGGWISRWPLAFFIGATAGLRLLIYFESDFVRQIQNTLLPLIVLTENGGLSFWHTWKNLTIVGGVVSSLVYFYFSFEHTGFVGGVSRVGIWVLMITFGASFAYTVMGRIALLAQRLEFLFDDWLWIIDPLFKRH